MGGDHPWKNACLQGFCRAEIGRVVCVGHEAFVAAQVCVLFAASLEVLHLTAAEWWNDAPHFVHQSLAGGPAKPGTANAQAPI